MADISDVTGLNRSAEEMLDQLHNLRPGSGGPYDGGMEARIAKLEAEMKNISKSTTSMTTSLSDARERLVAVEVKIDHLPSKGFIVSVVLSAAALVSAISLFSDTIVDLFGQ